MLWFRHQQCAVVCHCACPMCTTVVPDKSGSHIDLLMPAGWVQGPREGFTRKARMVLGFLQDRNQMQDSRK